MLRFNKKNSKNLFNEFLGTLLKFILFKRSLLVFIIVNIILHGAHVNDPQILQYNQLLKLKV